MWNLQQGKVRAAAILLVLLVAASPLHAHEAQRPHDYDASHQFLRHQWAPDGLFGAMGSFVTDLGMHVLHLFLSGPSHLLLDELSSPGANTLPVHTTSETTFAIFLCSMYCMFTAVCLSNQCYQDRSHCKHLYSPLIVVS